MSLQRFKRTPGCWEEAQQQPDGQPDGQAMGKAMQVHGQLGPGAALAARDWQPPDMTAKANQQPSRPGDMPRQHRLEEGCMNMFNRLRRRAICHQTRQRSSISIQTAHLTRPRSVFWEASRCHTPFMMTGARSACWWGSGAACAKGARRARPGAWPES